MALVLAHRGANRLARENTVAAFAAAAQLGADGVELDVRHTADGALVVLHDANLEGIGPVAGLAAAALPSWLPSLSEALDACAGLGLVNVEIKADHVDDPARLARRVARLLVARRPDGPSLLVSSFSLEVIGAHHAAAPQVPTGWLAIGAVPVDQALAAVVGGGHAAFHPHESMVSLELVEAAHARGVLIATWTVDDPERAVALAAMGVDAIITDVPDLVRAALAQGERPPADGPT